MIADLGQQMKSTYDCTVFKLLQSGDDEAIAISGPRQHGQSYKRLREQGQRTVSFLNGLGITRNNRVALVLPNGPKMAAAFATVTCGAAAAPLNPTSRKEEFNRYLSAMGVKALVVERGSNSPALAVAMEKRIPVVELHAPPEAPAGQFHLTYSGNSGIRGAQGDGGFARPTDVALVLHTSGTVASPKIVPLSQSNICASARNICEVFSLSKSDSCLNIMPLFHVHGLIPGVLASLHVGARVICTPRFDALKFFSWLGHSEATWYTAVPTMHQAILARACRNKEILNQTKLRFIRSASAPLPPQVMTELERTFACPVIDSYALTEAATQVSANPLPPSIRKPGSVGPAAGVEVSIMDEKFSHLPRGQEGEIVIRGPSVMSGYDDNPKANSECFIDGWFRTGDLGRLDQDRYLWITGRIKEIINRGGEKISPFEVEATLRDHPAVQQAVAFGVPHKSLGEDVAAAVVLREGQAVTVQKLQNFASGRLVRSKVPRRILILEEIPKGPTGKVQRRRLAERLDFS